MRIGELAQSTGTRVETIRYYEKEGLLPRPARSDGNYRLYGSAELERLRFIRNCRDLDLSLDEIRVLLRLKHTPADACGGAEAVLDAHLGHVNARLRALRALERDLKALRASCAQARDDAPCGILSALGDVARAPSSPVDATSCRPGDLHPPTRRAAVPAPLEPPVPPEPPGAVSRSAGRRGAPA